MKKSHSANDSEEFFREEEDEGRKHQGTTKEPPRDRHPGGAAEAHPHDVAAELPSYQVPPASGRTQQRPLVAAPRRHPPSAPEGAHTHQPFRKCLFFFSSRCARSRDLRCERRVAEL
ncbi:hypothetical protein EYF80_054580 [Liparis tanakae]|uniref:Uncharacterized protein n=1 Tax=Liparis tanakae TaxID=230148 RepID=A0A4Z2F2X2_9TELE|nr:hypothetical protein EYF80_054580 [Liparis tanakae]